MSDFNVELNRLKEGIILAYESPRALISIKGPDARNFLQRMSTNDIGMLTKNRPVQTAFTNNKGGMVDHCIVYEIDDGEFLLVSSHHQSQPLIDWLEQYHFIENLAIFESSQHAPLWVLISSGSQGGNAAAYNFWHGELNGTSINFSMVSDKPKLGVEIDANFFETLRIACLMPASRTEINDTYMPQNLNLAEFIAENKGCYIGQEVIAKAKTYQKRVRTLCGASFSENDYARLQPGILVLSPDNRIGTITSIAPHFLAGITNALVITEPSKELHISANAPSIMATIAPFRERIANKLS